MESDTIELNRIIQGGYPGTTATWSTGTNTMQRVVQEKLPLGDTVDSADGIWSLYVIFLDGDSSPSTVLVYEGSQMQAEALFAAAIEATVSPRVSLTLPDDSRLLLRSADIHSFYLQSPEARASEDSEEAEDSAYADDTKDSDDDEPPYSFGEERVSDTENTHAQSSAATQQTASFNFPESFR